MCSLIICTLVMGKPCSANGDKKFIQNFDWNAEDNGRRGRHERGLQDNIKMDFN